VFFFCHNLEKFLFCNACKLYKGQGIKLGAKARGRTYVLCVALDKWVPQSIWNGNNVDLLLIFWFLCIILFRNSYYALVLWFCIKVILFIPMLLLTSTSSFFIFFNTASSFLYIVNMLIGNISYVLSIVKNELLSRK